MFRSNAPDGIVMLVPPLMEVVVLRSSMHPFHVAGELLPPVAAVASCWELKLPPGSATVPEALFARSMLPAGCM